MATIETTDSTVEYFDEGDGTPFVLLPGGSLDVSYLGPFARKLADSAFRVVRVNPRGVGRSTGPLDGLTMHDIAADVIAVIEQLGLAPTYVAGHAFGNRVARTVALDATTTVRGVVLLAAGGTVQPSPEAQQALQVVFSDVSRDEAVDAMRYMVGTGDDAEAAWETIEPARSPEAGAIQRDAVVDTPADEWRALADGVEYLIVQGTDDQIAPMENGRILAREGGDRVTLATIDGGGHLFALSHPTEAADAIVSWTQRG